jgi:hypothetical protein
MFLVFSFLLINLFSPLAEAGGIKESPSYCKGETSADELIESFRLSKRDIGFPISVHAIDGEVETHTFNTMRVLKEIKSVNRTLSFWTIESNQGIHGLPTDGYTSLLNLINKLEQCQIEKLSEKEMLLLTSYFPTYGDEKVTVHISSDGKFLIAISNSNEDATIVYSIPKSKLVIRGDITN